MAQSTSRPKRGPSGPTAAAPAVSNRTLAQAALTVGALGVVFGDIGTSPIYTIQTAFNPDDPHPIAATQHNIYGVISLIFWSVTLIVTVLYVSLVMRRGQRWRRRHPRPHHARPTAAGARRDDGRAGPRRVRDLRCVAVLRRQHHHAGDLRALRGRGAQGRRALARAPASSRSPRSSSCSLFISQRLGTGARRQAVRTGHDRLVRVHRHVRDRRHRQTPADPQGAVAHVRRRFPGWKLRAPRSSRSRRWCSPSREPRRCTPTWVTSVGRRSSGPGCSWCFPPASSAIWVRAPWCSGIPRTRSRARSSCSSPDWGRLPMVLLATAGHRHRIAGGHHRGVLGGPPGGPARLPASPAYEAHLGSRRRADLRAVDQLGPDDLGAHAGVRLPQLGRAGLRLRHSGHRHDHDHHAAVLLHRAAAVGEAARSGTGRRRGWRSCAAWSNNPTSWWRTTGRT